MVTEAMLRAMARGTPKAANLKSMQIALNQFGAKVGLDRPHRLAQFLAQILHESGSFKYDREVWGPTPAQKRYEGRKDLGNTQKGDGAKFKGYTPGQITGRANTTAFYKWCVANFPDLDVPNFVENPELMNTDPWEGLGPIWYWDIGNPDGKSLNRYADDNNILMVTKRINGGTNGLADRLDYYTRAALVILGYKPTDVKKFQQDNKAAGEADGIAGEKTRMALHVALKGKNPYASETVVPVPVEKPVVPEKVEQKVKEKSGFLSWLTGLFGSGAIGLGWLGGMDRDAILAAGAVLIIFVVILLLLRSQIIAAVRDIKAEIAE